MTSLAKATAWQASLLPANRGEDFFCGAASQFSRKICTKQNIDYCRCFSRTNGVAERFVEPTKTFIGSCSKLETYDFSMHGSSLHNTIRFSEPIWTPRGRLRVEMLRS